MNTIKKLKLAITLAVVVSFLSSCVAVVHDDHHHHHHHHDPAVHEDVIIR